MASGANSSATRTRYWRSWKARPLAPNSMSCATVGHLMRLDGSPRNSRSNSGSGIRDSDSMWLVAKPSIAFATGISDSALKR